MARQGATATRARNPTATYDERLAELNGTLALAADPADRANLLIGFADRFREVPPEMARRPFPPGHLVPGCESEAYIWGVLHPDGAFTLHFAVENPSGISAKALATVLDRTLSGLPPAEVARVTPNLVYDVFRRDISMGKGLGLMAMVNAVQAIARQAAALSAPPTAPMVFPRTNP